MTRLCVAIFVHHVEQALRDIALATEAGAEAIELRIDISRNINEIHQLIRAASVPVIITCRAAYEGGQCDLSDRERLELLVRIAQTHDVLVDFEYAAIERQPGLIEQLPLRSILSSHDFQTRPAKLHNLVLEMNARPAEITKIVWQARTIRDNLEAFELLQQREKPTIALCMGDAGVMSRILGKKFGAYLTFAALRTEDATAPGQVSIDEMKRLYRWDAINPSTKVYGVVADPVRHSMSPAVHNASFDETHYDGIYLPLLVNAGYESFKAFMESALAFEALHLSGLSITIPHKENALRYLKEKGAQIEPLAESIGAVNTIAISSGAQHRGLRGFNTDYTAILDSITSCLNITRIDLKDKCAAVLGAGGTGRTAVAALAHHGATVVVYNRSLERAEALAQEFNGRTGKVVAAAMHQISESNCDIYINTTSLGMSPNVNDSAFGDHPPKLDASKVVFDSVYNPIETKLLRQAMDAGAKTINGVEMFVRQAAAQFEAWTQLPAPVDVMRQVILARLSK
jgi:3-dehydroquinate dehydratase/shikimate dehydrogenase